VGRARPSVTVTAPASAAPSALSRTRIAVIGYTDHRQFAPYADDAWEIWGLNDLYYELPVVPPARLRWFQLHEWREVAAWKRERVDANPLDFGGGPPHPRDPNHVQWLARAATHCPVYLMDAREEVPDARVYPKAEAFRYFSLNGEDPFRYFTNSISWMLALAIMELCPGGPGTPCVDGAELGVWGVDMMMGGGNGSEYGWQRPSCEFFLGWARACGIRVHLPKESDLLASAFVYGDPSGAAYRKKVSGMRAEYGRRLAELRGQASQITAGINELQGAINTLEWQERSWMPGDSEAPTPGRAPTPNSHKALAAPAGLVTLGQEPPEEAA
jgi:hypothetical protein